MQRRFERFKAGVPIEDVRLLAQLAQVHGESVRVEMHNAICATYHCGDYRIRLTTASIISDYETQRGYWCFSCWQPNTIHVLICGDGQVEAWFPPHPRSLYVRALSWPVAPGYARRRFKKRHPTYAWFTTDPADLSLVEFVMAPYPKPQRQVRVQATA